MMKKSYWRVRKRTFLFKPIWNLFELRYFFFSNQKSRTIFELFSSQNELISIFQFPEWFVEHHQNKLSNLNENEDMNLKNIWFHAFFSIDSSFKVWKILQIIKMFLLLFVDFSIIIFESQKMRSGRRDHHIIFESSLYFNIFHVIFFGVLKNFDGLKMHKYCFSIWELFEII
jgi:hypothetical protein